MDGSLFLEGKGLINFKTKKGQRMDRYFSEEKETLSKLENAAQELSECLFLYHQVRMREPKYFASIKRINLHTN